MIAGRQKGSPRVTPHSDPPTVGRKYGNHPLGDCPALRTFNDRPTKQSGCAQITALLERLFVTADIVDEHHAFIF